MRIAATIAYSNEPTVLGVTARAVFGRLIRNAGSVHA